MSKLLCTNVLRFRLMFDKSKNFGVRLHTSAPTLLNVELEIDIEHMMSVHFSPTICSTTKKFKQSINSEASKYLIRDQIWRALFF